MEPAMTMHLTMVVVADASFGQPFSVRAVSEPFSRELREFSKKTGLKRLRNGFSARNAYTNAC